MIYMWLESLHHYCKMIFFLVANPKHMAHIPKCNIDYDKSINNARKLERYITSLRDCYDNQRSVLVETIGDLMETVGVGNRCN